MTANAQTYNDFVRQGIEALGQDSLTKAESCFRDALKDSPSHHGNYLLFRYLGQIQERQGRTEEALTNYTAGLALNPRHTDLMLDRAALYFRLGNEQRALMDYTDALELAPDNKEALQMRAYIYSGMHSYKQARRDYEALLELEPQNLTAWMGLILVNDRDGRQYEAMQQADGLIRLYPHHAALYAIRGGMEQKRKQYERAVADLTRAIELDPKNPDYYVSRATLYIEMNRKKQARTDVQAAVRLGADPREMAGLLKK